MYSNLAGKLKPGRKESSPRFMEARLSAELQRPLAAFSIDVELYRRAKWPMHHVTERLVWGYFENEMVSVTCNSYGSLSAFGRTVL